MSMNVILVSGRIATDPTLSTVNEAACTSFTVASDTRSRGTDGKQIPIFYRVTAWRRLAETTAQYLHKGDPVTLTGDLSQRSYVDRNGQPRTSLQITLGNIDFPSRKSASPQAAQANDVPTSDDELPI